MTQNDYLELLLNDCGFHERINRNDFLSRRVGRPIKYLDDMTGQEKSRMIDLLKDRRSDDKATEAHARGYDETEDYRK